MLSELVLSSSWPRAEMFPELELNDFQRWVEVLIKLIGFVAKS